jgi:hypothetical protein
VTATTYQTVRLSPGKHPSPDKGACVMELSSMLAGEPFSDRPASVCPVIAAMLRGYNDFARNEARQELRRYAVDALGTRGTDQLEERRLARCFEVFDEFDAGRRRALRRRLAPLGAWQIRALRSHTHERASRDQLGCALARYFGKVGPHGRARFLELIDELVAMQPRRPVLSVGAPAADASAPIAV